ncbi:hypothetical protein ACIBG0_05490 [Nocardia sp. NPDC050630]
MFIRNALGEKQLRQGVRIRGLCLSVAGLWREIPLLGILRAHHGDRPD